MGSVTPQTASGWGCTAAAGAGLLAIVVAMRWSVAAGLLILAILALLGWRSITRAQTLSEARRASRVAGHGSLVGDVWRRLFVADGLGDLIEAVAPHVRTAIRVSTTKVDTVAPGASRIGGTPDLPAGTQWPHHNGLPLAFVAQFDLGEMTQVDPEGPLPRTGHLWFFVDAKNIWEASPSAEGSVAVLYASDAALVSREPPPDLSAESRFSLCAVTLEPYQDLPDPDNEPWLNERLAKDAAHREAYYEIHAELESGLHRDTHKLLGYAGAIQGPMEEQCELASRDISFASWKKGPRGLKAIKEAAREWRLLFQVESDGNARMMWGDAGRLYFWIREDDLRAACFDKARVVFQCH